MKLFSKWLALLAIALGISVQGYSCEHTQSNDNYYVQSGGVYVAPNGIFVMHEGKLIQVDMLCADAKGIYVPGIEMSRELVFCPFCRNWFTPERINNHDCRGPE